MDALLGILNNPLTLNVVGLLIKYAPGIRKVIANKWIGYINVILAWAIVSFAPAAVHASVFDASQVSVAGFSFHFLGGIAGALKQAGIAYIINEMLLRHVMPPKPPTSK